MYTTEIQILLLLLKCSLKLISEVDSVSQKNSSLSLSLSLSLKSKESHSKFRAEQSSVPNEFVLSHASGGFGWFVCFERAEGSSSIDKRCLELK